MRRRTERTIALDLNQLNASRADRCAVGQLCRLSIAGQCWVLSRRTSHTPSTNGGRHARIRRVAPIVGTRSSVQLLEQGSQCCRGDVEMTDISRR
jgi:hypothetical protein